MIKKFTKKELERLECSEEEIKLVMECQRKLPIIFDNDNIAKFCVDGRTLWIQLESKRQFSDWISQKIKKSKITRNVDYITFSQKCEKPLGGRPSEEFTLTMRIAQHLAMLQNNDIGFKMRDYFILMEDLVKRNKEWLTIRDPEKEEYKKMSYEIEQWMLRVWHKSASRADYACEADAINKIVTGLTSQELKIKYGCPTNELIRDYLKKDHNEELLFLEIQNQVLLRMDMGYKDRMSMLTKMHEATFKSEKSKKTA